MILLTKIVCCENEHGTGDVTFPEIAELTVSDFGERTLLTVLRKRAKEVGWGRVNGADYCPACMESM